MDRASELRLYYSSSVVNLVRILHPNTVFMKNIFFILTFFPYQPFQCIGRNDTFTSAITLFEKASLTVDIKNL